MYNYRKIIFEGNVYPRGRNDVAKKIHGRVTTAIRRSLEQCENISNRIRFMSWQSRLYFIWLNILLSLAHSQYFGEKWKMMIYDLKIFGLWQNMGPEFWFNLRWIFVNKQSWRRNWLWLRYHGVYVFSWRLSKNSKNLSSIFMLQPNPKQPLRTLQQYFCNHWSEKNCWHHLLVWQPNIVTFFATSQHRELWNTTSRSNKRR